jgi:hypothetical protein
MLKKLLIIIIIFIFSINSFSTASIQNQKNETIQIKSIEFSEPVIDYSKEYAKIMINETNSVIIKPDKPIIPVYKKTYIYPKGTKIKGIDYKIKSEINKEKILKKLQYSPTPIPPLNQPLNYLSNIENINNNLFETYPDKWFDYEISSGINNGEQKIFVNIIFYPIRYYQDYVYYFSECEIEIEIENNKETMKNNDNLDLIIIGPEEFSDHLQRFVDHKESKGIKTRLITLESIYDGTYFPTIGRDNAEKVKYLIKNAYDNWEISYVLLVGGLKPGISETWYTPVRYVYVAWPGWENRYISDLYFADIYDGNNNFSTWDTDNNDVFSEWPSNKFLLDEIDLYPEVYVGRWPCRNKFELKIIVDKTINYENTHTSNKIVLVGGDNFEEPGIEGEIVCDKSIDYLPGFEYEKVYSTEIPLNPKNIRNGLGEGSLFLHMHGHGSPIKWGTHPPENFEEWEEGLFITDVPWFSNSKYPITLLGGCHTAMFNVSNFNRIYTYYYGLIPDGLGWWIARKINGGGIATLGYTCYPSASPGEYGDLDGDGNNEPDCVESGYGYIQLQILKAYGIEDMNTLGECWGYAVEQYLNAFKLPSTVPHLHTVQGFVNLGDPSLKIGGYN